MGHFTLCSLFTMINSLNARNNLWMQALVSPSYYKWENKGLWKFHNISKVRKCRAGFEPRLPDFKGRPSLTVWSHSVNMALAHIPHLQSYPVLFSFSAKLYPFHSWWWADGELQQWACVLSTIVSVSTLQISFYCSRKSSVPASELSSNRAAS